MLFLSFGRATVIFCAVNNVPSHLAPSITLSGAMDVVRKALGSMCLSIGRAIVFFVL